MNGTCPQWAKFTSGSLVSPLSDKNYMKITAHFNYYNYKSKIFQNFTSVCVDKLVIIPLISSMDSGNNFEGNCDGSTWR